MAKTDSNEVAKTNSKEGAKKSPSNEARAGSHSERVTRSSAKGAKIGHQSLTSEDVLSEDELDSTPQTEMNRVIAGIFDETLGHKDKLPNNVSSMDALEGGHGTDATQMSDLDTLYRQQTENYHSNLSWTACYDDSCEIHLSDKIGSRWFPKQRSKKRRMAKKIAETSPKHNSSERELDCDSNSSVLIEKEWQAAISKPENHRIMREKSLKE